MSRFNNLGQAPTVVASGVVNSALDVYSARKLGKMQARFVRQLASDSVKMEYVQFLVDRFRILCEMIVSTTDVDPSSLGFQAMLKEGMAAYAKYDGNCKGSIKDPTTKQVIGDYFRDGRVENTTMPKETGLIWSTGCKNALDAARIAYLREDKDEDRFAVVRDQMTQLGNRDTLVRFALWGGIIFSVLIALKMQFRVIKATSPHKKKRHKKKHKN